MSHPTAAVASRFILAFRRPTTYPSRVAGERVGFDRGRMPSRRRRLRRSLPAIAGCALVLASVASSATGDTLAGLTVVTVEYSGVLDESFVYDPANPGAWQENLHFTFTEKRTVQIDASGNVTGGKAEIRLSGRVRATHAPPNNAMSCTGTFSLRKTAPDPFTIGATSVTARMPLSRDYVTSSSAAPNCSAVGVSGAPFQPPYDVQFGKAVVASCERSRSPCTFRIDSKSPTNTSSLRATLTFGPGGGSSGPKPPPTPALVQAKKDALEGLRSSLTNAVYPCLVAAGGTSLLAAPLALLPGVVLVALSAPLCASWGKAISELAQTVADPPSNDYDVVATVARPAARAALPGCAKVGSAKLALCRRVQAAASAFLTAVDRYAATAAAVRKTVERDSAAKKAGNKAAVTKQEKALTSLKSELAAATAARRKAGAGLASALRDAKAPIKLTRAQVAEGFVAVKTRVARSGLGAAKLSAVAGPALTPRPIDVLVALGR